MINMKKKDLENILKAKALLREEKMISNNVMEILKVVQSNQQGQMRQGNEMARAVNIKNYEQDTITPAFNDFATKNPKTTYVSYNIVFAKDANGSVGVVTEVGSKVKTGNKFINRKEKVKSLQYTMTTQEIAKLGDIGEKYAAQHAHKVLEIIADEWKKAGYTVEGYGTNQLVMTHPDAQNP
tara:strand:- start:40 stop:585 length:546 start_codon:yes stop_codon:yes gene_type:complete